MHAKEESEDHSVTSQAVERIRRTPCPDHDETLSPEPLIVILNAPVAAEFELNIILITVRSKVEASLKLPENKFPILIDSERLLIIDCWTRQVIEVAAIQVLVSHWETPYLTDDVADSIPIPSPYTDRLKEPVTAEFIRLP